MISARLKVQALGETAGGVSQVFDRDGMVQRRNQKGVERAPVPEPQRRPAHQGL